MKRIIATAAAVAAALGLGLTVSAQAETSQATMVPLVGGALRCTNGAFAPIVDAGHATSGIAGVTTTSTYIEVRYTRRMAKVGFLQVTADETYAVNGSTFGASVGLDRTRILVARYGKQVSPKAACALPNSNIWLSGYEAVQ
jgi:hypothetical protein